MVFFLIFILATASISAAEKAAPARIENRFLFVLETSASMSKSAKAAQETILGLLRSGIHGQMRPGDTFGIWTYNSELQAGRFPMQRWSPTAARAILEAASKFLEAQKYEKQGNLDKVLKPLFALIGSSKALTVILISEGKQSIQGMPFDENIYALYQQNYSALHEANIPFVTVLVVREGAVRAYAVNSTIPPLRIPNMALTRPSTNSPATMRDRDHGSSIQGALSNGTPVTNRTGSASAPHPAPAEGALPPAPPAR